MLLILRGDTENTVQADLMSFLTSENNGSWQTLDGPPEPLSQQNFPTLVVTLDQILGGDFIDRRLIALINSTQTLHILVAGVPSNTPLPNGKPITERGGAIFPLEPFVDVATDFSWVFVYYDIGDCNGRGYHVMGQNNKEILMPRLAILFHELSHAFHLAIRDAPHGATQQQTEALREVQAINDENLARQALVARGFAATTGTILRDPAQHEKGGCGPPKGPPQKDFWTCFMISAAYGSSTAPESLEFQKMREGWLGQSILANTLFRSLSTEYVRFALNAAKAMEMSNSLRAGIKTFLIEPLLNIYRMIDNFVKRRMGDEPFDDRRRERMREHYLSLVRQGYDANDIGATSKFFTNLTAALSQGPIQHQELATLCHELTGSKATALLAPSLEYLTHQLRLHAHPRNLIWGVVEPVTIYWEMLTKYVLDDQNENLFALEHFVGALKAWILKMPVPLLFTRLTEDEIRNELRELSHSFFTNQEMKSAIGKRLTNLFEDRVSYDLPAILTQAGFRATGCGEE
jgi:hypothetical protein